MKNVLRFLHSLINKKSFVIVVLALSSSPHVFAAPRSSELTVASFPADELTPEKPKVRFGARLGVNVTNTNFNQGFPQPPEPIATQWKTGVVGGFFWQIPLHRKLFLQQEYLFSQMGGAVKSTGTTYQLRYLSLPLLLQYKLLPKLALVAGPQFDLLLQGRRRVNGTTTTITHDTEERSIGATAGLEFYLTDHLSLDARYMQGLNHVGIGQRSAVQEFKHQMVQVAAAVRF